MDPISVNRFRDNLKALVQREQETLYVLQNNDLMRQVSKSLETHDIHSGYAPTTDEMNEITGL